MSSIENLSPETRQAAELMLRAGTPIQGIIDTLGLTRYQVETLAKFQAQSTTFSTRLNAKDAELADKVRTIAHMAIQKAEETLMFGAPADQNILVRAIVGRSMALVGAEKESKLDDLRAEFEEFVSAAQSGEDIDIDLPEDMQDVIDLT